MDNVALKPTTRPIPVRVDPDGIAPSLKVGRCFVLWRWEWRLNKAGIWSWTKPPKRPDRRNASSTDAATWVTFDDAMRAYLAGAGWFDGIGRALALEHGLVGIDLDHVRDPVTGALLPWAARYVALMDSYCEVSPSAAGLRIFVYASLPPGRKSKAGVEMWSSSRYVTLTGYGLPSTRGTVEHRQAELNELRRLAFGETTEHTPLPQSNQARRLDIGAAASDIERALSYINADDREIWFAVGAALHAELGEAGRGLWDAWSSTSVKFDEADQARTWSGYRANRGITIGTLFHFALKAGWRPTPARLIYDTDVGAMRRVAYA